MLVTAVLIAASYCNPSLAFASEAHKDHTCNGLDAPEAEAETLLQMFQSSHILAPAAQQQLLKGAGALAQDKLDLEAALLEDDDGLSSSECQQRDNVKQQPAEGKVSAVQRVSMLLHGISDFMSLFQDIALFAIGFAVFFIWRVFTMIAESFSKPKERSSKLTEVTEKDVDEAKALHTTASGLEVDALVQAMYSDNKDDLRKFLDARSVNACDDVCCCTALHVAAHYSCLSAAEALLARGADANVRDVWDETPLHFAARAGNGEVCALLLEGRADANASNVDGYTPLIVAATAKNADICKLLLDRGAHTGGATEDEVPPVLQSILAHRIICGATDATEDA